MSQPLTGFRTKYDLALQEKWCPSCLYPRRIQPAAVRGTWNQVKGLYELNPQSNSCVGWRGGNQEEYQSRRLLKEDAGKGGECAHHPINYCMGTGGTCQATSPIANCGTCSSTDGDVCTACLPATTSPTTQYCPAVIQGLTFACTEQENCAICSDLEDGLCGKCATNYCMGTGGTCQATSPIANCGTCSSTDGDVCTACLPFSGNTMYCPAVIQGLTFACTEQENCAICDASDNGLCGECAAGYCPQGDGTCAPCLADHEKPCKNPWNCAAPGHSCCPDYQCANLNPSYGQCVATAHVPVHHDGDGLRAAFAARDGNGDRTLLDYKL